MYRTSRNAKIGGLCAAFGETFGIKTKYIRIGYVLFTIFTQFVPGIFLYFLLCFLIPKRDEMVTQGDSIAIKNKDVISNSQKIQNNIRATVEQITKLSASILGRQKSNPLVGRIIEEFKDKIMEFEKYSPELEKQYIECIGYLKENSVDQLKVTIQELKSKIDSSSDSVKTNYINIMEQQEKRLQLLDEIKDYTEIIESKLYLILNTLQNIEASILHAELQTQVTDNNYDNLQSQISILTENMSEMNDIFRKNKIRL